LPRPVPVDVGVGTFIDSDRVNAGSDLDNEIDDNILAHLPADLWREDIEGIKHEKKIRVTKRRRRAFRKTETATPADPELLVV